MDIKGVGSDLSEPTTLYCLLQNYHPPRSGIIPRRKLVEIDTTGNPLTPSVAAVPIGRTTSIGVIPRPLMTQIQFAHQRTVDVVDTKRHIGVICQVIRYPRLRVERIGVVCQQSCLFSVSTPAKSCSKVPVCPAGRSAFWPPSTWLQSATGLPSLR